MLASNQRGRGNDPVVVLGSIKSAVAVNVTTPPGTFYPRFQRLSLLRRLEQPKRLEFCKTKRHAMDPGRNQ